MHAPGARYTGNGVPRSRPLVLVVEDDTQLARLYCASLTLRGITCLRVADGFTALRSIEEERPDLILLDLNLPAVSGFNVLRDLASNPATSGVPVIVVTGVEPTPQLPDAMVVLCKPCDPDHVANIVRDHLPAATR